MVLKIHVLRDVAQCRLVYSNLLFRGVSCHHLHSVSSGMFLDYLDPEHGGRKHPQNVGNCANFHSILSHNTLIFTNLFCCKFSFAIISGYYYKHSLLSFDLLC
jgi:hypothetical protein